MAKYIRIDNDKDFEWLKTVVTNWLNRDPNNHELAINYVFISNWDKYLKNAVSAKSVADDVEIVAAILTEEDVKKVTPKPKPITNKVKQTAKKKGKGKTTKSKVVAKAPIKVVDVDPYKCSDHTTYGAKYKPRTDCKQCWDLYKQFHPMEFDKARRQFLAASKKG